MVGEAVDELLVLGADAPVVARLLAAGEDRQQVVAALDRAGLRRSSVRVVMAAALSGAPERRQHFLLMADKLASRPRPPSRPRARPARRFRRAGCAGRARRRRCWARRGSRALLVGEAAFGADQDAAPARAEGVAAGFAAAFVGEIERRAGRGSLEQVLERLTGSAISGSAVRPHCSAASIAMRAQPLELEPLDDRAAGDDRRPAARRRARSLSRPASRSAPA